MSVGTATQVTVEMRWEFVPVSEAAYWSLPERESGVCSKGHVGMARGDVWFCDRLECGEVWRWPGLVGGD